MCSKYVCQHGERVKDIQDIRVREMSQKQTDFDSRELLMLTYNLVTDDSLSCLATPCHVKSSPTHIALTRTDYGVAHALTKLFLQRQMPRGR